MKTIEHIKTIGGIEYELAVRDETTGYFGTWFCRHCHTGGVKYELLPEIRDALMQAERGAIAHHESEHSRTNEQ